MYIISQISLLLDLLINTVYYTRKKMNILLFGMPASGKGTQAQTIADFLNLKIVSMGTLLRKHLASSHVLSTGNLVADNVIEYLISEAIEDRRDNLLFDGVPRSWEQAKIFTEKLKIHVDAIIELNIDEDTAIHRIENRLVHLASGRTYNIHSKPPIIPGLDDITMEPLTRRTDDSRDVIRHRIKIYHELTEQVLNFYMQNQNLEHKPLHIKINGNQQVAKVAEDIKEQLLKLLL